MGGDRERLCHELDQLKELGITNVRILSGPDAGSILANPAKPYLQTAPGVLNDTILEGLDYVIAELEKRDMDAVIYLNNAWDWSASNGKPSCDLLNAQSLRMARSPSHCRSMALAVGINVLLAWYSVSASHTLSNSMVYPMLDMPMVNFMSSGMKKQPGLL